MMVVHQMLRDVGEELLGRRGRGADGITVRRFLRHGSMNSACRFFWMWECVTAVVVLVVTKLDYLSVLSRRLTSP